MRAIRFSPPFSNGQAADNVIGEPNLTKPNTTSIVSDSRIVSTFSVTATPCGLWVADSTSNRMLFFP
uniref:Uncharacterized protein n=1 Tax=Leptospira ellisii TaxID=2023197 RepID=A0A2N0B8L4_9LEPT|nr:hypothetical protein CH379_11090 [Leptospira ellisii]